MKTNQFISIAITGLLVVFLAAACSPTETLVVSPIPTRFAPSLTAPTPTAPLAITQTPIPTQQTPTQTPRPTQTATPTARPADVRPHFQYPDHFGYLDLEGSYMFGIRTVRGASAYRWKFIQGGVVVYETIEEAQDANRQDIGIHPDNPAHAKFKEGSVQVIVQAKIQEEWSREGTITITLVPRSQPSGAATPTASPLRGLPINTLNAGQVDELASLDNVHNPTDLEFASDGFILAADGQDGFYLYTLIPGQRTVLEPRLSVLTEKVVRMIAISPDGQKIAGSYDNGLITLWDATTGAMLAELQGHQEPVYGLDFSPNGAFLASASRDGTLRIWNTTDYAQFALLEGHTKTVWSAAFSPNGQRLASASADGTIRIWDMTNQSLEKTITGHTGAVFAMAFSPDGKTLASGAEDGKIMLWDTANWNRKAIFTGHSKAVFSLDFNADGTVLVSGSEEGTILLWDTSAGLILSFLRVNGVMVNSVVFSPDGTYIAAASQDNFIRIYGTP